MSYELWVLFVKVMIFSEIYNILGNYNPHYSMLNHTGRS